MRISRMIQAVDAHACGEPGRVIVGGVLDLPGDTVFKKMKHIEQQGDSLRKVMLNEPRGYPASNCNLIVAPCHPEADAGYIIMEHTEYPGMSGTNTICVATVLLETGMLPMKEPITDVTLESPAGLIRVRAECSGGKVKSVTFKNVPAFAVHVGREIDVPHLGKVTVDVAYGGMFYVLSDATRFGLKLVPEEGAEIVRIGEMIKAAAQEQLPVVHPDQPGFSGITIAVMTAPPLGPDADARNAVVVSTGVLDWDRPATWTGVLDRSPCGTGTCARMVVEHARGKLRLNEDFRHESILGTLFTGRLLEEKRVGDYSAFVPSITGQAWITGFANYVVDADDPFPEGFTVGDIW